MLLQPGLLLFLMRQYSYIFGDSPFSSNNTHVSFPKCCGGGDGDDGAVVVVIMVVLA